MKRTVIVTARVRDEFAILIRDGRKTFEVRNESFLDAQAIHYVSAYDGHDLGTYRIERSFPVSREEETALRRYAAITDEEFDALFPLSGKTSSQILWVAQLGESTTLTALVGGK